MENISIIDVGTIIALVGLIFVVLKFFKDNKKETKAEIEEAKEYKMKVEKALINTDENRKDISETKELVQAIQELTKRMGLILEDIAESRGRMIELELLKADGVELLLNHHKEESVEIEQFQQRFTEVKQKAMLSHYKQT